MISTLIYLFVLLILVLTGYSPNSDMTQEFIGMRLMAEGLNPYPAVHASSTMLGAPFDVPVGSTHPPTAFLLSAPAAFFSWPIATMIWGWLMVAATIAALRLYGFRWRFIIPTMIVLAFTGPFVISLSQIGPIWLLGLAMAYRYKNSSPLIAGLWIGFASLTKFLPGVMLILFIVRRKWSALVGFALVWGVALLIVTLLSPAAIPGYLSSNQIDAPAVIAWDGNGAFLVLFHRFGGWFGLAAGVAILLLVFFVRRKDWLNGDISEDSWHMFSFLCVALLPICWTHSLLPIIPGMLLGIKKLRILAGLAFLVAAIVPLNMPLSPYFMAILFGLLLFDIVTLPKNEAKSLAVTAT